MSDRRAWIVLVALLPMARIAVAQAPAPSPSPSASYSDAVQVTATRIPEDAGVVPASIDVISGQDLKDRGARDLREALSLVAGIDVAPGGDNGPASSVPEFWGLKEFDAFLLVVDGVPWGGAFNPALAALSLENVERIEVQKGAAPVMYGATSFVGVVQVVRRSPADTAGSASLFGGSYGSGGAAFGSRLPKWGGFDSALSADAARQGYKDDRTSFRRGHVLWRNHHVATSGTFHFDVDGTWIDQDPASPHVRQGAVLSPLVPLDANHNPDGAFLNEKRAFVNAGYEKPISLGSWNTTLAFTHVGQDVLRGFLADVSNSAPNASGFRAKIDQLDLYFDTHLAWTGSSHVKAVFGLDHLHSNGDAEGDTFHYFVNLDGSGAPGDAQIPLGPDRHIEDRRDFSGLYGFLEWNPAARVSVELGARLNRTEEERGGEEEEAAGAEGEDEAKQEILKLAGSAAVGFTLYENGSDRVRLFADYKNSFKPAAADFNLVEGELEGGILDPETAQSVEAGLKARFAQGRGSFEASAFMLDFKNLVIAQVVNGLPSLRNAGTERFKGIETALGWRFGHDVHGRATYAWHDARFRDFLTEFDGVPTQLAGKRFELSAHHLASGALSYLPKLGLVATLQGNYVGERFLNKRNTAPAEGYFTYSASLGYRFARWELRAFGQNLNDRRDPVSESEVGDAQYYRLTARRLDVMASLRF